MFDSMFADVDDSALAPAIERLAREEAQAGARRLAAIAELVKRTTAEDDERQRWVFDSWANTAAQVGAALNVGQRRASGQMRIAVALRERLPLVAALYCQGALGTRLISEITWRTLLVTDDDLVAVVDAAIAEAAADWGPLSEDKLGSTIDATIARYDPEAVRRSKALTRGRDVRIGASNDPAETAAVWAQLLSYDAAVLERRITAMVGAVCKADPRTVGERRSDAFGALVNGNDRLPCHCGSPDCPSAGTASKSNVVVRVIADPAAVEAARKMLEVSQNTDHDAAKLETDAVDNDAYFVQSAPEPTDSSESSRPDPGTALVIGRGVLPTAVLAEAIRAGAKVKPLSLPCAEPESRYRPSAELAEYVRMRDLFCRFPGCDVPADRCDIDHTIPWPLGPTHPSNLACKCRTHHLMKTFWGGSAGWRDVQLPDATIIWTSPSGQTYTTKPGGRLFFPTWDTTTANLPPPPAESPPGSARSMMMPTRRRTRAADEAARIKAERAMNSADDCPF